MKIVIDTNVLMAGMIRDSTVRNLLISKVAKWYMPERALYELLKHKDELCDKAGYTQEEFETILSDLLHHINLIESEELTEFLPQAKEAMKGGDITDAPFLAACFSTQADRIWSFDNGFNEQKIFKVFKVKELVELVKDQKQEKNDKRKTA